MFKEGNLDPSKKDKEDVKKKPNEAVVEKQQISSVDSEKNLNEEWKLRFKGSLDGFLDVIYENFKNEKSELEIQKKNLKRELERIRFKIENHEISCILVDDNSARVPALVFEKTINEIYKLKGEDNVPILFIYPKMYQFAGNENRQEHKDVHEEIKRKISNLFVKSNVVGGTALLVTDFIITNATVRIFEEIARDNHLDFTFVNDSDWHNGNGSLGMYSGLKGNRDRSNLRPDIHSESLWKKINQSEDPRKQFKLINGILSSSSDSRLWTKCMLAVKKEIDSDFSINVIKKSISMAISGEEKEIENLLINELPLAQWKTLVEYIHNRYFTKIRKEIAPFSEQLAREFIENGKSGNV